MTISSKIRCSSSVKRLLQISYKNNKINLKMLSENGLCGLVFRFFFLLFIPSCTPLVYVGDFLVHRCSLQESRVARRGHSFSAFFPAAYTISSELFAITTAPIHWLLPFLLPPLSLIRGTILSLEEKKAHSQGPFPFDCK